MGGVPKGEALRGPAGLDGGVEGDGAAAPQEQVRGGVLDREAVEAAPHGRALDQGRADAPDVRGVVRGRPFAEGPEVELALVIVVAVDVQPVPEGTEGQEV